MRIALVSEHASPLTAVGGADAGGQNVHVAALASGLARRGNDVVVHTRRDDPLLPDVVETPDGYRVHHVDAGPAVPLPKDRLLPWMGMFGNRLADAWSAQRPDLAHAHFWMSGLATVQAAMDVPLPVALTFHALGEVKRRHQGGADTSPAQRTLIERRLLVGVDRVIATCSDEVFELRRMGADGARVDVIPCGVDLARFGPAGPTWPRRGRLARLLSVARLVPRKGLLDVVAALQWVPDAELLVAGGSPEPADEAHAAEIREVAERLGVGDRVTLLGSVSRERMPELVRSCDVLVHTPWYEPFGIVPLEAMACGRPVVASAVGGLIDTVVDGRTGLHVHPRDPRSIAAALNRLLDDPVERDQMGRAGLVRARRRYDWSRISTQTEAVYRRMCRDSVPQSVGAAVGAVGAGDDPDVVDLR